MLGNNPMGKVEIEEKIAARKIKASRLEFISDIGKLLAFWPFFSLITWNIVLEIYSVLVQPIETNEKRLLFITQNYPTLITWLIVYYAIRRVNKRLGW